MDDVVDLIYQWLPRPDNLEPVVLLSDLGGGRVEVLKGSGRLAMTYCPPAPPQFPGCAWAGRVGRGGTGDWVVVLSNFQAPLPLEPLYDTYYLVDGGPGPDGYWGTADDEAGAGDLITEGGLLVVEG